MKQTIARIRRLSKEVISKRGRKKPFSVGIPVKYYENH